MKIEKQIKSSEKDIADLEQGYKNCGKWEEKSFRQKLKRARIAHKELLFIQSYLETKPSKEFIQSEIDRVSKLLDDKMGRFEYWYGTVHLSSTSKIKAISRYKNLIGEKEMKSQIKLLNKVLIYV